MSSPRHGAPSPLALFLDLRFSSSSPRILPYSGFILFLGAQVDGSCFKSTSPYFSDCVPFLLSLPQNHRIWFNRHSVSVPFFFCFRADLGSTPFVCKLAPRGLSLSRALVRSITLSATDRVHCTKNSFPAFLFIPQTVSSAPGRLGSELPGLLFSSRDSTLLETPRKVTLFSYAQCYPPSPAPPTLL